MKQNCFSSLAVASLLLFVAACQGPAQATEPSQPEWVSLFDGETTAGWLNYGSESISNGWQAIDGELTMVGGGGDIVTEERYCDFELELEWKISVGGNSGIFYGVVDGLGAVWFSGPEMQVLDNGTNPNGASSLTSAGACYGLYKVSKETVREPGQWNHVVLRRQAGKVTHTINGATVCEYVIGSDDWNARVAASKFKDKPLFGKVAQGRIALQDHGNRVAYRNLRIRRL